MEVRIGSKAGAVGSGIDPVLAEIQQGHQADPKEWLAALAQNPSGLVNPEQEIHRTFARMADRVVAGLLAQATADTAFADCAKKSNTHRRKAETALWRVAPVTGPFAGRLADQ